MAVASYMSAPKAKPLAATQTRTAAVNAPIRPTGAAGGTGAGGGLTPPPNIVRPQTGAGGVGNQIGNLAPRGPAGGVQGSNQFNPYQDYGGQRQPTQPGNSQLALGGNNQRPANNNFGGQFNPQSQFGAWNPNVPPPPPPTGGNVPNIGGGLNQRFNATDIWEPGNYNTHDAAIPNFLERTLPLAQLQQGQFQYGLDVVEAQRRNNRDYGLQENQNNYQQQLSTRQQQMAEQQQRMMGNHADRDFAQRQRTDQWGNQIANRGLDLQGREINNTGAYQRGINQNQANRNANDLRVGMDQNQANRDVANTYGGAQRYGADQQRIGQMYGADQQLAGERYGADQQLAGNRYMSENQLQGTRYQADQGLAEAGLYSGAQRYGTDAQERMNTALMANNLQTSAMGAFGRSQAPKANWSARSWG
jgi:hypothetical protein